VVIIYIACCKIKKSCLICIYVFQCLYMAYRCVSNVWTDKINYYWFTCPYYVFHLTLTINCFCFVKYHSPIATCNGQNLCSKWGNSCISNTICIKFPHFLIHQTVIATVRFRSQVVPRGICGGQSGTGTGVSPSASVAALSLSIHQCPILIWLPVGRVNHRA
jgi:hypothetical protein